MPDKLVIEVKGDPDDLHRIAETLKKALSELTPKLLHEDIAVSKWDWVWKAVNRFHLGELGSWVGSEDAMLFKPSAKVTPSEFASLSRDFIANRVQRLANRHFEDAHIAQWVAKFPECHEVPSQDRRLIAAALLSVWERCALEVEEGGEMVLGGEYAYCPIYKPAKRLYALVLQEDGYAHAEERGGKVYVRSDGDVSSFAKWKDALDYIVDKRGVAGEKFTAE